MGSCELNLRVLTQENAWNLGNFAAYKPCFLSMCNLAKMHLYHVIFLIIFVFLCVFFKTSKALFKVETKFCRCLILAWCHLKRRCRPCCRHVSYWWTGCTRTNVVHANNILQRAPTIQGVFSDFVLLWSRSPLNIHSYSTSHGLVTISRQTKVTFTVTKAPTTLRAALMSDSSFHLSCKMFSCLWLITVALKWWMNDIRYAI